VNFVIASAAWRSAREFRHRERSVAISLFFRHRERAKRSPSFFVIASAARRSAREFRHREHGTAICP